LRRAIVTVGLGFGDEGKGSCVDFLVRASNAAAVIRYNGGPQASHHVVLPDGRWHGFSQLGAGSFVPGVRAHLSRAMLVEPQNLLREAQVLREKGVPDAMARLSIDPRCTLVTPFHKMLGQILEQSRGEARFGSVGMGVGQAVLDRAKGDALSLGDTLDVDILRRKLSRLQEEKLTICAPLVEKSKLTNALFTRLSQRSAVEEILRSYHSFSSAYKEILAFDEEQLPQLLEMGDCVLEGAQGSLLDPNGGFAPYVTKTTTTLSAAQELLSGIDVELRSMGILRAYHHRHGAGPLVTEDSSLSIEEPHNKTGPWQGAFRIGYFDLLLARYALSLNPGVDELAVTCLDQLSQAPKICISYQHKNSKITELCQGDLASLLSECRPLEYKVLRPHQALNTMLAFLRDELKKRISLISLGPTYQDKIYFKASDIF
jgi:adenylosuccinate synthase